MAKINTLPTLETGYYNKDKLNKAFEEIKAAFENTLSRDGSGPNHMKGNFDIADGNLTNVNQLYLNELVINGTDFVGFSGLYVYKLAQLACGNGAMITHDSSGDPICLEAGDNGEVLKTIGEFPTWAEDTDTDTVGVTIQEDGVTVAENVTTIDFIWTDAGFPTIVTTPAGNQVDIALDDVYTSTITALWEDGPNELDSNVTPSGPSASMFGTPGEVIRLDLVNDVGISVPTSDNEYYVIVETSNLVEDSSGPPPAEGTWNNGVKFFDATGSATPLTGVEILAPVGEVAGRTGTTAGGNLLTTYCGIPAGTRYIDFDHADAFLFPIFSTYARVNPRYRAVLAASAKNADFQSPEGISYPGGTNPTVTTK